MSLGSYNAVTVGTSATLIIAANAERKGLEVCNNSSATIYIGPDANITTSNAMPIAASQYLNDSGLFDAYRGALYGIVVASTADVRFWEWIQ